MSHQTDRRRSITAQGFARLLERLHADPEQAALEYERLHRTLIKFFDWRGVSSPEECADEALDRLARKLEETTVDDVRKYVHGIARLIFLEQQRGPRFSPIEEHPHALPAAAAASEEELPLHRCFDRCLSGIPEQSRSLLVSYYEGERDAKISNRRRLAATLGVTENALRSRVQRLRDRLEQCVHACISETESHEPRS